MKYLLSNTSGLPTIEDFNSMRQLFSTGNWAQTILQYPLQTQPGQSYTYSSTNFHLAVCLLERVLGGSLLQFAVEHLFQPLGIPEVFWECDPQGVPFGGSDLYPRPEDMLTIGRLCLQDGRWNNQCIVPETRLKLATQPVMRVDEKDQYGYGWWINHNREKNSLHSFSAYSVGGQRIIVSFLQRRPSPSPSRSPACARTAASLMMLFVLILLSGTKGKSMPASPSACHRRIRTESKTFLSVL